VRLALDTGLNTGWAIGLPGRAPVSGTKVFKSPGTRFHGRLFCDERKWLERIIAENGITHVANEAPIHTKFDGLDKLRIIYPMISVVQIVCHEMDLVYEEIEMDRARMAILGFARAPKHLKGKARREWIKARVVAHCIARGWAPKDDNEADAQIYLEYLNVKYSDRYAATNAGPLLTGAPA
jgi:hypothetical protein